jgi:hypothetical protein
MHDRHRYAPDAPRELAQWGPTTSWITAASFRLFGRTINSAEAEVILRHPGREVTVRPERMRRP